MKGQFAMAGEITFTDEVNNIWEEQGRVCVTFCLHAAVYKLAVGSADFDRHLASLKASLDTGKGVTVVVRQTDIVGVS